MIGDAPLPEREIDATRAAILTGLLGSFPPGRLIDLATGSGWFAQLAAGMGWQVTAIDARLRDWPLHPGITWRQQDVRDADIAGYDLVLCLGIFYHLPFGAQMDLFAKCAGVPIILDTHVSLVNETAEGDGYAGRLYGEPPGLLSAFGNPVSFWPTLESLKRMLKAHGYTTVTPVEPWYHGDDRTFFTCRP